MGDWALDLAHRRARVPRQVLRSRSGRAAAASTSAAEPEPEPEPEAPKPVRAATAATQKDEPPPPPAQAGKILTQEPDPNEPVDLTGQGFVTGNAEDYAGGVTANNGTSTNAVRNRDAAPGGVQGGTGTKAGPPSFHRAPIFLIPPRSRAEPSGTALFPPKPTPSRSIFSACSSSRRGSTPTERSQDVKVIADPGNGFGRDARQCALRQRWNPAIDREGHPKAITQRINVKFQR